MKYPVVNVVTTGELPPLADETVRRLCDAVGTYNWESDPSSRKSRDAVADLQSILDTLPQDQKDPAIRQLRQNRFCPNLDLDGILTQVKGIQPSTYTPEYPFTKGPMVREFSQPTGVPFTPPPGSMPVATGGRGPGWNPPTPDWLKPYPPAPGPIATPGPQMVTPTPISSIPPASLSNEEGCWRCSGELYEWGSQPSPDCTLIRGMTKDACDHLVRVSREVHGLPPIESFVPKILEPQPAGKAPVMPIPTLVSTPSGGSSTSMVRPPVASTDCPPYAPRDAQGNCLRTGGLPGLPGIMTPGGGGAVPFSMGQRIRVVNLKRI